VTYVVLLEDVDGDSYHILVSASTTHETTLPLARKCYQRVSEISAGSRQFPATVNQHPPVHRKRWMVSGQETVICWVPVP